MSNTSGLYRHGTAGDAEKKPEVGRVGPTLFAYEALKSSLLAEYQGVI